MLLICENKSNENENQLIPFAGEQTTRPSKTELNDRDEDGSDDRDIDDEEEDERYHDEIEQGRRRQQCQHDRGNHDSDHEQDANDMLDYDIDLFFGSSFQGREWERRFWRDQQHKRTGTRSAATTQHATSFLRRWWLHGGANFDGGSGAGREEAGEAVCREEASSDFLGKGFS